MARSQAQVTRFVRGLVAVVVVLAVALSSRAVQAQAADTSSVDARGPQLNISPLREMSPGRAASVFLLPRFSPTGELARPALQTSRRSNQGGGSHKVAAGIGGAMLGGLVGVAVGSWMARNSHSADGPMTGGMIGFSAGVVVGAVVMAKLAR
jgi:hypothetical protein